MIMMQYRSVFVLSAVTSAVVQTNAQDPQNLCPNNTNGYRATPDCRGYVYCNNGYVSGGIIDCWPNQLFDEIAMSCTYWQNVDTTNNCPEFDGSKMMPELTDGNANPERFYVSL